ncbi:MULTISPECIES: lysylphosphatidylglycerol synthase domain-containing protein [unclassified Micromonospora]|uniref:lysylphosphatidylglycerol synthase domain-containing protein n=1 Tax=unclassified Micromonospora TaxID=2617518 RepID=UPI001B38B801|nr:MULTISPECIES: lysylphosphatidylglycerol synthase domain-containing protein [unclassified Micromonospora]MBQ1059157.1 flippase-like domain-containing protein [Micromonospora sp. C41]WBB86742.1 lysylphosphatidylglycerol synthase domain-containing protein [Micromonospora sp. WMMC264]
MGARTHRPSPALLVSLTVSACLLAALSAAVRSHRVPRWEQDLFTLLNHLPAGLTPVLVLVMQLGSYPAVFVAAAAAVIARRIGAAWTLLLAGNLAYWLAAAVKAAVARQRPAALFTDVVLRETITGRLGYPSGHVAVATALALVAARAGGPRWRRAAWVVIGLVAVARIHVGAHLPIDVAGGVLVGWLAVCLARLVVGEVGPQRSVPALRATLRRRGIEVAWLAPIHGDARGSQPWQAVTTGGRRLFVKVTGGEQRDADWVYKLYRRMRYRHVADAPPYLSARQQSEHETCLTLLAARAGVRIPAVVTTAAAPGGDAVLVQEFIDAAPLDAVVGPVPLAAVRDAWDQVARLHRVGIAHRDLRAANVLVGRDHVYLVDLGFGADDASAEQRARDVVELMVALAGRVDPAGVVDAAIDRLGVAAVADSVPFLQPAVLSRAGRTALRARPGMLDSLRQEILRRSPDRDRPAAKVVRISRRTVLELLVLGLVVHLLLPQLGEIRTALGLIVHANPVAVAATLLGSALTYLLSGLVLRLATAGRVPLGEATLVQVAASFANRLAPGSLGGAALSLRYLHQKGLVAADAGTAVAVSRAAGVVSVVLLLPVLLPFARQPARILTHDAARALPLLLGALAVLLVLAGVLAVPRVRRRGRAAAGQVVTALRELRHQHGLRWLVVASTALTLTYGLCLYVALIAAGPVPLAHLPPVILVCLVGEGVSSAAPTPGGLGATEAALVSGLLLYGVPLDAAVAGTLIYRLATFWLPVPPGYLAFRLLTRRRLL